MSTRKDEPTKLPPSLSVVAGVENNGPSHAEQFLRLGFSPNISYLYSIAHLQFKINSVLFSFFPFNSCYVVAQPSWPLTGEHHKIQCSICDSCKEMWSEMLMASFSNVINAAFQDLGFRQNLD